MNRWYVYVLLDAARVKRYVGATEDLPRRMREHERTKTWMREFQVLDILHDSWDARDCERAWIRRLLQDGCPLENVRRAPSKP